MLSYFPVTLEPISHAILQSMNFIPSSSYQSRGVEEEGISIPFNHPRNTSLHTPKLLFLLNNLFVFSSKHFLKIDKESRKVVGKSKLNTFKSGTNSSILLEKISKNIFISLLSFIGEGGDSSRQARMSCPGFPNHARKGRVGKPHRLEPECPWNIKLRFLM